jgi:hypothetical protein
MGWLNFEANYSGYVESIKRNFEQAVNREEDGGFVGCLFDYDLPNTALVTLLLWQGSY